MLRRTLLSVWLLVCVPGADVPGAQTADLVLTNAVVHTMDTARPRAEAVAIRGARILAVGSFETLRDLVGPGTRVRDLAGRTVVPGFDDSHAHLLGIGFARLDVDLVGTRTYEEIVERVGDAARRRAPGEWIRGRGWHEEKWARPAPGAVRGFPTHAALSAVSPENPVVLARADGHAVLANARAMALLGITNETATPSGGEIIRDAEGNLTGVFVDNATALLTPGPRTDAESRRALRLAMEECLEKGVTSLTDAGATVDVLDLYRAQAARGELSIRVYAMAAGLETLRALEAPEIGLGGGFLTIRSVKAYADGALGSRGAALLEPYADDPGTVGLRVTPAEVLSDGDPRHR
jgi:predicted amidohydrolase YtcJ